MEAKINARRQLSGGAVLEMLQPERDYRDELRKRGVKIKDFGRENYKRLKALEAENRRRQAEAARPPQTPPFRLARFEKVLARTDSGLSLSDAAPDATIDALADVPAALQRSDGSINHLRLNVARLRTLERSAKAAARVPAPQHDPLSRRREALGELPKYLVDRKLEMAQALEERRRRLAEKQIPPGFVVVSDDDRARVTRFLERAEAHLLAQLKQLPLAAHSAQQLRTKVHIEARLAQIDTGLAMFAKRHVLLHERDWLHIQRDMLEPPVTTALANPASTAVLASLTQPPRAADTAGERATRRLFQSRVMPAGQNARVRTADTTDRPRPSGDDRRGVHRGGTGVQVVIEGFGGLSLDS